MLKSRPEEVLGILEDCMPEVDKVKEIQEWVTSEVNAGRGNKEMPIDLLNHIDQTINSSMSKIDAAIEKIKKIYPERFF